MLGEHLLLLPKEISSNKWEFSSTEEYENISFIIFPGPVKQWHHSHLE